MTAQTTGAGDVVTSFGSALRQTRIVRAGRSGYQWLVTPPPADGRIDECGLPGFVVPRYVRGELVYAAPGPASLALSLLAADESTSAAATAAFGAVLPAVAALHAQPSPAARIAPGPARLMAWLDGAEPAVPGDEAARAQLRALAVERWGRAGTATIAGWAERLATPATPVRIHGWFSTGSFVHGTGGAGTVILAEPKAYAGAAELDLGWLVGELLQLETFRPDPAARLMLRTLRTSVLRPYPALWNRHLVATAAVCRIATHAHDFATYVGWHDHLRRYIDLCRRLIGAVAHGKEGSS